ncbi:MAG: hypothetical protein LBT47_04560 [Deltaproteobacteria bacterium]|jgi:MtN3 and saliva related transmembrane protein|nr:hypothetical protein [Deltaproteobacteria bacterium]
MEIANSFGVETLGLVAGVCLIVAFMPQAWKAFKTHSVNDLSLSAFLLQATGVVLWIIYGVLAGSLALVITNSLCLIIYLCLIILILRYRPKRG